jgi:hypothetical protein
VLIEHCSSLSAQLQLYAQFLPKKPCGHSGSMGENIFFYEVNHNLNRYD